LKIRETKTEREYKIIWLNIWMNEKEMMKTLHIAVNSVYEKITKNWRWQTLHYLLLQIFIVMN
jgi:hypothetical protein